MANEIIPRWPISNVPILSPKGGDNAVHISGALGFLTLGLYRFYPVRSKNFLKTNEWILYVLLFVGCITIATSRAAILTIVSTFIVIIILRPSIQWGKPILIVLVFLIIFVSFDLSFSIVDNRLLSSEAITQTIKSIFNSIGVSHYDGPRQWRIDWWSKIVDYTIFGDYFWTGKGYGINLANDDGFQVYSLLHDYPLRSPHNSHLTYLARSGVPGFIVWVALQGTFGTRLLKAYRKAVREDRQDWASLNLWVLTYWFAFMVNASFDVFLEGPQGGIWFWCLFGYGMALVEIQRYDYNSLYKRKTKRVFISCV
jgi:O-antigen ligase